MGWIKHEGNKCPVVPGKAVWVKFRDGTCMYVLARTYTWDRRGTGDSIVYYSTDEVCPDALHEVGGRPMTLREVVEAEERQLPGMSEREFVQRYLLAAITIEGGTLLSSAQIVFEARAAYHAIDEALKGEVE